MSRVLTLPGAKRQVIVDHPDPKLAPYWWRHEPPEANACWVCGEDTKWIYLDIGYQHTFCDRYPTENGDVMTIKGWTRSAESDEKVFLSTLLPVK